MHKLFFIALWFLAAFIPMITTVRAQTTGELLYTPDSSVKYAINDILTIPSHFQSYIRYISLYNVPIAKRQEVATTVSFVINSLSRRRQIYIPIYVGGSDNTVIRVNLQDYDINPKIWDSLGLNGSGPSPFPEPYFHASTQEFVNDTVDKKIKKTKKVPTGRYYPDGQPEYRTETIEVTEKIPGKVVVKSSLVAGPWLDANAINTLNLLTQSNFPIYRADWFIVYSTVEPLYHQLLNLGESTKTFEKAVFANDELAQKARSQTKGVVVKSTVARHNRTLLREPTFTGGYIWASHDTLTSINDRNYVQNLLDEKFDASEIIASLPNGLQVYFVTDGNGKRLDEANNEIATDHTSDDKIVRTGRSCIYCHNTGILPIQDEIRILNKRLQNKEQISLLVANQKDAYRVQDLFGTNMDLQIVRDQQIYADAVAATTGLSGPKNQVSYFAQWEGYIERLLTIEDMARECSLTVAELNTYARLSNDPLFLGLIKQPVRPVRRDQWEQAFQSFMILIIRARTGEKPTVAPTILLNPDFKEKAQEPIHTGDVIEVITDSVKIYKPNEAKPCAIVRRNSRFRVLKVVDGLALIETSINGKVWIEIGDVRKIPK